MKPQEHTLFGQDCWTFGNDTVEVCITKTGGHMAPVEFCRDTGDPIQPYYISPWQEERLDIAEPVLRPLRGDFFCLPFGANDESGDGDTFCVHGEPASALWQLVSLKRAAGGVTALELTMDTHAHSGTVNKRLSIAGGHNVVYCCDTVTGYSRPMPLGHHATLETGEAPGNLRVSTSPFTLGITDPLRISDPLGVEYRSLLEDARFDDLTQVPTGWSTDPPADLTAFPARKGYTDLAGVYKHPGDTPAWTAAVSQSGGYVWFSLKDPSVLPATVFWISNRGRQASPWNGRNRCLGLEDVCGYLALGVGPSTRENPVSREGFPTAVDLTPGSPTPVRYIQGAARVPDGFDIVQSIEFEEDALVLCSRSGRTVTAPVCWSFLEDGELEA